MNELVTRRTFNIEINEDNLNKHGYHNHDEEAKVLVGLAGNPLLL